MNKEEKLSEFYFQNVRFTQLFTENRRKVGRKI